MAAAVYLRVRSPSPSAIDEPSGLIALREYVLERLPHIDLPEILLEIQLRAGFADVFTHIIESRCRVENLAIGVCAVLQADACNIGLEPLVRGDNPASDFETFLVYKWFLLLSEQFFETRPIGALVALEMGFRLKLPDGVVIRKPDFAVVRHDNPQPILPLDVSYHGVLDLCVEALSDPDPRDIERDTVRKKAEYAAGGVPEYYILHREPGHQAFFTRTEAGVYVPIPLRDGVIHSQVLPGFRFRAADLCRRPSPAVMRDDPVYADFVLPDWWAADERAEALAERISAEQEAAERRADAEARRRAEQELAALRARLGRSENPRSRRSAVWKTALR